MPSGSSEYKKSGKKLDMGKGCVRFKKLEDLALDVIRRTTRLRMERRDASDIDGLSRETEMSWSE